MVAEIGSRPTYRRARTVASLRAGTVGAYRSPGGSIVTRLVRPEQLLAYGPGTASPSDTSWRVHSDASRQARTGASLRARYRVAFRHTSGGVISLPPLAAITLGITAGHGRSLVSCCAYSTSVCPSIGRKQPFGRPRWERTPRSLGPAISCRGVLPTATTGQRALVLIGMVGGETKIWR